MRGGKGKTFKRERGTKVEREKKRENDRKGQGKWRRGGLGVEKVEEDTHGEGNGERRQMVFSMKNFPRLAIILYANMILKP